MAYHNDLIVRVLHLVLEDMSWIHSLAFCEEVNKEYDF